MKRDANSCNLSKECVISGYFYREKWPVAEATRWDSYTRLGTAIWFQGLSKAGKKHTESCTGLSSVLQSSTSTQNLGCGLGCLWCNEFRWSQRRVGPNSDDWCFHKKVTWRDRVQLPAGRSTHTRLTDLNFSRQTRMNTSAFLIRSRHVWLHLKKESKYQILCAWTGLWPRLCYHKKYRRIRWHRKRDNIVPVRKVMGSFCYP